MCKFTNMASCSTEDQSSYLSEIVHGDSLWGGPRLMIINHTLISQWKRNLESTYIGRRIDNWVTQDSEIGFPTAHVYFVSSCILIGEMKLHQKTTSCPRWVGIRSVLQSTQYYQILFSLVNYCTIYNYYCNAEITIRHESILPRQLFPPIQRKWCLIKNATFRNSILINTWVLIYWYTSYHLVDTQWSCS
jgi:hypothetical protein